MGKRFIASCFFFMMALTGYSFPFGPSDFKIPTGVAPGYWGPNAFPVPDMMTGRTSADLKLEAYFDSFWGNAVDGKDYTSDVFMRLTIPCFTPRVNIVMWGVLNEYCHIGPEANAYRGVGYEGTFKDNYAVDFYISADVMILAQEKCGVDLSARAAVKTASGHRYDYARFYDSPGYFFDASVGREFSFAEGRAKARLALSTGFLCWQTDVARQNDAVMYGALASLSAGRFDLAVEYGGYIGWERYGDQPMTLKTSLSCAFGNLSLRLQHQVGFVDWPYNQIRFGAEYRFNFRKK